MPELKDALVYTKPNGLRPRWAVFPLNGKAPAVSREKGGHGCHDASADPEKVAAWWREYPRANIGLATGKANGLVVIDVDRGHADGVDGEETLKDLEEKLGPLPHTVEVLTPNGGRHLYFRYPSDRQIASRAARADFPGVDIRADGGYVAAPPSRIRIADGSWRAYEWEVSSYPHETPLKDLPEKWLDWAAPAPGRFTLPDPDLVAKGTRHDTLFRYGCSLRAKGSEEEKIREALTGYNARLKEPLGDSEVAAIARDAAKYDIPEKPAASGGRRSRPLLTLPDFKKALSDRGYRVRHNLITGRMEISGVTPAGRRMTASDLCVTLYSDLCPLFSGCSMDTISQFMAYTAREHTFNPFLELMEANPWDGKDRLEQLYEIMEIGNDPLSRTLLYKWLLQGAALQFNEEKEAYGADGLLVLNGSQGAGKTSLFRHLALRSEWFGEGSWIDDRDKDTSRRTFTKFIAEMGEAESTLKKSDIFRLKALITDPIDEYRLPYGRYDVREPRRTNLCATCNTGDYLIDPTGNRRWWTIPFNKNLSREELLELDAVQLWAQIHAVVSKMEKAERAGCFRLTQDEREALEKRNSGFEKPVKGQEEVADILDKAERDHLPTKLMTITEFKEYWDELRYLTVQQVGIALKRNGIEVLHGKRGNMAVLPKPGPANFYN